MPTVNDDYQKNNLTDLQLKALAIQQYETGKQQSETDPTGHKFPTEIIELPSKGLFYSEDNPLASGKIEMKYMTAREEDILTTPSLIKQGVVLDRLFQSLIVGNGEGKKINYGDLLFGDKNAVMIAARILGYGKDYEIKIETPSGEEQSETVDLSLLKNKELDETLITPHVNRFSIQLPISKRTIEIKLLSHDDEKAIEESIKSAKKYNRLRGIDSNITIRLAKMIVAVDGNSDKAYIQDFIENYFLARDVQYVREFLTKVQPDVDLNMIFIDQATGEEFEVALPIGLDFFWPAARV
jgi:hypothetical protein